ncbi:hypothetical protein M595_0930 [Lyngbya aestuarii BL J]|uniref:DUF6816 domain-containing protein n=1 Tax=Lyngbya aestuarii BL J TaxID=1348334 RepID=U7QMI4_9CYAN|nr:hypothetical protein [Lyngbya aestuarii]ERT09093.1 hypothetical protein M595_0930 [Lyngbya aestuarii BL J]
MKFRRLIIICLFFVLFLSGNSANAGQLSERVLEFPDWDSKPILKEAEGDLIYPEWMAGEWQVTSTLVKMVAPNPEVVTPGFEQNRQYLNQPLTFNVRFYPQKNQLINVNLPFPQTLNVLNNSGEKNDKIVGDRAFNGLNIAQAILGEKAILSVKVDPQNPNKQITFFNNDNQLLSTVTRRGSETPSLNQFVTAEIFQQIFQGETSIYLNEVETTTAYTAKFNQQDPEKVDEVTANQITAIYLSPQDPDYFKAQNQPVSLYQYQLKLLPINSESSTE